MHTSMSAGSFEVLSMIQRVETYLCIKHGMSLTTCRVFVWQDVAGLLCTTCEAEEVKGLCMSRGRAHGG